MKGAIDFRFRPIGLVAITEHLTREYCRKMRVKPCESFEKQSLELMFAEMDAAGIEKGVIGVRMGGAKPGFVNTDNKEIARWVKEYPTRFIGFGSLDTNDPASALEEIERSSSLGLVGLTVEPSTARVSMHFDERRLYPIYEEVQRRKLPLLTVMSCLLGPYMDDVRPESIDRVATDFPDLTIIIQHGAWPYFREAIGIAYKRPNVFLVPGQYLHYEFPGGEDIVKAANRQLEDQVLFGSVYPNCGSLVELMKIIENLGFANDTIKYKYLQGNARRILNIP